MKTRVYGQSGPTVVLLHGGPGAPGHMAPVARGIEDAFRVLEPFQRFCGERFPGEKGDSESDTPLTVARHVADLHHLIEMRCPGERPALVGSSWGAMLALAYGAAHPSRCGPLVLVGCGTFDLQARARMKAVISERMDDDTNARMQRLTQDFPDPAVRLKEMGRLISTVQSVDLIESDSESNDGGYDEPGHYESWNDMLRLQAEGVYPSAFAAIRAPVLMLHGSFDPHPGAMIRDSLAPYLPQLEYVEWERCGHYPWLERSIRGEFFAVLRGWVACHAGA